MSKTNFQDGGCDGHIGFPIDTILALFHPGPVATEQISAQIDQRFGKGCRKLISKTAAVAAIWIFDWLSFSYIVSTRGPMLLIKFQLN